MKAWLISFLLAGGIALIATPLRAKVSAFFSGLLRKAYHWLFILAPAKIDFSALPPQQQGEAYACVQGAIYNLVRLEEILLPDHGLGAEKKKRVVERLTALGLHEAAGVLISDMIDDAVSVMNAEARAALAAYQPAATIPPRPTGEIADKTDQGKE